MRVKGASVKRFSISRRPRGERGAVAVEFALIVPLLMLLVFGIMEFGYMLNRDTVVSNASRDGARVASLGGQYTEIMTSITQELAQSGIPTTAPATVITIDCLKPDGTIPCNVAGNPATYNSLAASGATAIISVTYNYAWITPVISSIMGTSTSLGQTTQMRVE